MPAGEERDALTYYTANQMKRDLTTWGHGSMDDEKVANDLAYYTDGVIQLDLNTFRFEKFTPSERARKTRKRNYHPTGREERGSAGDLCDVVDRRRGDYPEYP